ncbi:MAG: hypothetical protein ACTSRP_14240 [Candidatus Helarchaeota archaeon]
MGQKEDFIVVEAEKCIGCGNCLVVCHLNDLIDKTIAYGKRGQNIIFKIINGLIDRKSICYNCTDAPCIKACDKEILKKDENGLVYLDLDVLLTEEKPENIEKLKVCNECDKKCIEACPSKELFITKIKYKGNEYTVPMKCDLCGGEPECAKVCPSGAIKFVNILKQNYENKRKHAEILAKVAELFG